MGKIGIAVIGSGYWGINYVRLFNELPQSRTLVVCDREESRLEEIARRFPGVETTTNLEIALSHDGVSAAVVCTPATTHFDIARRCLQAGKHVLVEKPITTTVADAEALTAIAEQRERTLMVGHTFVHNSGVRKIRTYIERGELGQIYYLYARRTNMGPIRHDVNALWDLAPHDISIFNYLLNGVPGWVSAVGARVLRTSREDVGFISLGYPNGIIGHIHVSWADPNKVREVVVVGSDRRAIFDDLNAMERVRVFEKGVKPSLHEASSFGEHQYQIRDGDIISPKVETSEPLKEQCNHFLKCIAEGISPISGSREGTDVVRVMEAVDRSIEHRGAPVVVERPGTETDRLLELESPPVEMVRSMMEAARLSTERSRAFVEKEDNG